MDVDLWGGRDKYICVEDAGSRKGNGQRGEKGMGETLRRLELQRKGTNVSTE